MPLSGPDAAVGVRALRGILLAAKVFDQTAPFYRGVAVTVRDTGGTPEGAAKAVTELVTDERAIVILGPVTSRESPGAAAEAQRLRVPIITLTQREDVVSQGDFVFRSLLTPRDEARAVAIYGTRRLLITRFAILSPGDRFGRDVAQAFADEVVALGGRVTRRASYGRPPAIPGVLASLYDRPVGEPAVAPWDALFVPDDIFAARLAAERLRGAGVTNFKLLGTGLWNTPDATLGGGLEGAVFAAPFSESDSRSPSRAFSVAYRRTFEEAPDPLAAQAHDAAALVIEMLENAGQAGPEHLRERLMVTSGIEGAAGTLRFEGGRDARRGAVLLTIRGSNIVPVSPMGNAAHPAERR
ncbi:MAG: ABC transporter substrate-binding protein [Deltaproteobacteria bacterium]|nr:ABC transporter substrate-binding protein [Deltaproteobacteria bacterium]